MRISSRTLVDNQLWIKRLCNLTYSRNVRVQLTHKLYARLAVDVAQHFMFRTRAIVFTDCDSLQLQTLSLCNCRCVDCECNLDSARPAKSNGQKHVKDFGYQRKEIYITHTVDL